MLDFLFGKKSDKEIADKIIRYLKEYTNFTVEEVSGNKKPYFIRLGLDMALVDVEITFENDQIFIRFKAWSKTASDDHLTDRINKVKAAIRSYLDGSHAAKWRHRVAGLKDL